MASASHPDHDARYQLLFSHPGIVAQLLRSFVDGPWLADLDLEAMERLNTKFHAETGQRRDGDMIWRIPRLGGDPTYLVLLLEFQSTSDHYMALRVLAYAALLWQQLIREQQLVVDGKLPPLLPVVLYNGEAPWRGSVALRNLVDLPQASSLWHWQPEMRYHLIDACAFSDAELQTRDGLPALWFRLENAPSPTQVVAIADAVLAWLSRHPGFSAAQAAFVELLGASMAPLGPGIRVPEELLGVRNMLEARAKIWTEEWLQQGRQKGLQEGRQKGLQEGRQDGLQEGRKEGEVLFLLRLLEHRFGALPALVEERVRAADTALVQEWGFRTLQAASLEDVLNERQA